MRMLAELFVLAVVAAIVLFGIGAVQESFVNITGGPSTHQIEEPQEDEFYDPGDNPPEVDEKAFEEFYNSIIEQLARSENTNTLDEDFWVSISEAPFAYSEKEKELYVTPEFFKMEWKIIYCIPKKIIHARKINITDDVFIGLKNKEHVEKEKVDMFHLFEDYEVNFIKQLRESIGR